MKRIKIVTIVFSVALIGLGLVQYSSIKTNVENNRDIKNLNNRIKKISQSYIVLNDMLDIETGSRGYLLTGDKRFLEPYEKARFSLGEDLKDFYNYLPFAEVTHTSDLIQKRLNRASLSVEKKQRGEIASAAELELGKQEMDAIRVAIRDIIAREDKYIDTKSVEVESSSRRILAELISGSVFSIVLVLACVLYVLFELKKRMDAEKKLSVSLATSEAISREIDLGIIACTKDGEVLFTNRWINVKIPLLKKVQDFFTSNTLLEVPLKKLLEGEIDSISDVELIINGEKRVYSIHSSLLVVGESFRGIVLSIVDTTDAAIKMQTLTTRKKAAETASLAKSEFLAKMSHEIRTPLNAILGVGEILSMTNLDQEQEHALGIFRRSAHTLNNLVNEILDLSKIEAGKAAIIKSPFSMQELVESCTSLVDFRADQKGLLFEKEINFEHDHYLGDERRIRQILLNLLGNAVKFTEKGKIQLTITNTVYEQDYHEVRFSIKDTGPGVDVQQLENILQDYRQGQVQDDYGDAGLGLSLSKELARLMGGDILAASEIDEGSEFTFYVRLAALSGSYAEKIIDVDIKLKKLKILLVDDNIENRYIVKKYLANYDFEIREAVDGINAIEFFKREKFDLIFMDINMPKMDGLTATKEIREWEKQHGINKTLIIALSANTFTKEFSKAKSAGCDDYLTKPISRLKLITMIKKWTGEAEVSTEKTIKSDDEMDEEIKALIPGYLEKRALDLVVLKEALGKKEIQTIARIAHNIKGTALSYGQEELDHAARELNSVSHSADWVKVEEAILKIERALKK